MPINHGNLAIIKHVQAIVNLDPGVLGHRARNAVGSKVERNLAPERFPEPHRTSVETVKEKLRKQWLALRILVQVHNYLLQLIQVTRINITKLSNLKSATIVFWYYRIDYKL